MGLEVTREQLHPGGDYDAKFLARHDCGVCGSMLAQTYHDGKLWIECTKDKAHEGFERRLSPMELYKRGLAPFLELKFGPPGPDSKLMQKYRRGKK